MDVFLGGIDYLITEGFLNLRQDRVLPEGILVGGRTWNGMMCSSEF